MPLFDSLEREVSSFFVAQGSVFDTLVKTLLDRITHIETRVEQNNLSLTKLLRENAGNLGGFSHEPTGSGSSNDEMEYFVMTLARQLNVVLALLFRPYAGDAVTKTQARQQQFPSISDVLTDNESTLMGFTGSGVGGDAQELTDHHHHQQQQPTGPSHGPSDQATDILQPKEGAADQQGGSSRQESPTQARSTFAMIHRLHIAEEQRQKQENDLLDRMKKLLQESQALCQSQCKALHAQNDALLRELQLQNEKLSSEWAYQQQQQASVGLLQAQFQDQQKELDRQLLALSNTFLASQTIQEQQISRILESLRDFSDRFLSKNDLDQLAASWLSTARADCVYGGDRETLTQLQSDLTELQHTLDGVVPSPEVSRLQTEASETQDLLQGLLEMLDEDPELLHSPKGSQKMHSLRGLLSQLEAHAPDALTDAKATAFLSDWTRKMELGTASLLEAIETQQERYQQTLSQQQAELELLKLDVQTQKMSDDELRRQLSACPSQEDTLRLINALKEQLQASTSDSASHMLETLEDLRGKMTGLPTFEFLDELLQGKADRSEIDRLRLLLASQPNGPGTPSLSKSPTRCLSCDQSLPFMHSRPGSAHPTQHDHNQCDRPSSANPASSPSRPASGSSRPASRPGSPARPPVQAASSYDQDSHTQGFAQHQQSDGPQADRNRYVSPFTRAMLLISEHGGVASTHDILRDLAATIDATKRRRQRFEDQQLLLAESAGERAASMKRKTMAVSSTLFEPNRNRIPLRRTTLSDQVVYGPSISPGFLKPKKSTPTAISAFVKISPGSARRDSSDDSRSNRPKTAVTTDRKGGGDLIVRAPTTTVVIRPFSEIAGKDDSASQRRGTRRGP